MSKIKKEKPTVATPSPAAAATSAQRTPGGRRSSSAGLFLAIIAAAVLFLEAAYIVDQRQMAIVVQFGNIVDVEQTPGLKLHIPFIQNIIFFDNRIQNINFRANDANEIVTADQKTMRLEAFAKYRLADPLKFYKAVQSEGAFKVRLAAIFESTIREVVGTSSFIDVLSSKREQVMREIGEIITSQVKEFGVDVIDMRITRIGLPEKARMAVYQRMKTDRSKEAAEIRAQGRQEAEIIKAQVKRAQVILLADADKKASILKGDGDAESARILLRALDENPDFYYYYRSLQAYEKIFRTNDDSFMIVDVNKSPLFKVMREPQN